MIEVGLRIHVPRYKMKRRFAAFAFIAAIAVCRLATARERLAVFFVAEFDPRLADNLTEVAIAKAAETPGRELVGARELRARLAEIVKTGDFGACLTQPECLSRVGAAAGVERAVIGSVKREAGMFALTMILADTRSAAKQAEVAEQVPPKIDLLIAAVQKSVGDLFDQRAQAEKPPAEPAVVPAPPTEPAPIVPAQSNVVTPPPNFLHSTDATPTERSASHVPYVAYGAAGLAVASFTAAILAGSVGTGTPTGNTRADVQRDLERRKDYAMAANGLYVVGGALTAASLAAFVWRW
jgi:hypothetical protein